VLSDAELEAFLKAFDCADPVGLRDYAMARCLIDLGLRGHEVTYLTLGSVDWRRATLTISSTKSRRAQQLPLPVSTGEAIAQYLRQGRPQTVNRSLFVRHRAPFDKPLSVPAIRSSMNRAFVRCALGDRFCNTHVLRRTTATRLQRSGASVKEIADLLRHQSLDTASAYARIDLEGLRAVALPWPGSKP
jgi:integrase